MALNGLKNSLTGVFNQAVQTGVIRYLRAAITSLSSASEIDPALPVAPASIASSADAPEFSPADFSSNENCYAYALNQKKRTLDPGELARALGKEAPAAQALWQNETDRLSKRKFGDYVRNTVETWKTAVEADGLIAAGNNGDIAAGKPGCYLVALAVCDHFTDREIGKAERNLDYHWYRQDADGTWSHKRTSRTPDNRDAAGQVITDPLTADRGDYRHFIGYFFVPKEIAGASSSANKLSPPKPRH